MVSGFKMTDIFPELQYKSSTDAPKVSLRADLSRDPANPLFHTLEYRPLNDVSPATGTLSREVPSSSKKAKSTGQSTPKPKKPRPNGMAMTYRQMIIYALGSSEEKMMKLADIFQFLEKNTFECNDSKGQWKNSIRHNLSLHKEFSLVEKGPQAKYWTWDHTKRTNKKNSIMDDFLLHYYLTDHWATDEAAPEAEGADDEASEFQENPRKLDDAMFATVVKIARTMRF